MKYSRIATGRQQHARPFMSLDLHDRGMGYGLGMDVWNVAKRGTEGVREFPHGVRLARIARERLALYGECLGMVGERERIGGAEISAPATNRGGLERALTTTG